MYSKKAKVLIVVGLIAEITWGIRGYSLLPPSSEDLAQLVSEKGKPMIIENRMVIPHSYSLTKIIHDGVYQHTLNIQALSCEHKGRMEIRLTPTLGYDKTNLPFGYEITDWDCDGMNGESDDFRMYLGNDRWHHTRPQAYSFDKLFEPVSIVAVKPMYDELIKILYQELQK